MSDPQAELVTPQLLLVLTMYWLEEAERCLNQGESPHKLHYTKNLQLARSGDKVICMSFKK